MRQNKNYIKSKEVPENLRNKIAKQIEIVAIHILAPPRSCINIMFEVFNEYINEYPNDRHCSTCSSAIYKFWKGTVKQWRKDSLI